MIRAKLIRSLAKNVQSMILSGVLICMTFNMQPASAQTQTQPDTTGEAPDSTVSYISSMEYTFMMHEETSWMIKASVILLNDYTNQNPIKVAFEKRIANSFTLNLAFDQYIDLPNTADHPYYAIHGTIESRWYYRQNKRIKNYQLARNMSDNYFALGVGYSQFFNPYNYEYPDYQLLSDKYLSLYTKWGLQRRFLKPGHADMGVTLGLMNALNGNFKPSLVLNTYVEFGMCFTKDKYKTDHDKICPFVKCYEANRFVFKTNISDLFNIGLYQYYKWIDLSPHLAFERKIGNSPFSVNTEIDASIGYSETITDDRYYDRYWQTGMILEGRWYYNLKKRIRIGASGNGLSANYIAVGGSCYYIEDSRYDISGQISPQLHIATGFQRLIGNHMYFDLQLGVNYYFDPNRFNSYHGPRARLALGYRF
jgi:hypothetical protein